jgi:homoserine kinase type II
VPVSTVSGLTLAEHERTFWELEPWMEGEAELLASPDPIRVRAAFSGLAAFHQALGENVVEGVSPGIVNRLAEVEAWQAVGFPRLEQCLATRARSPLDSLAVQWLAAARLVAPRIRERLREARRQTVVAQPCLRDARPEHFLFQNAELTGLVDFGAMGVDTVATDLARLLSEWSLDSDSTRGGAIQAYSAIRPLSTIEHGLIPVFEETSSLLTGGRWAIWHYFEGREFRDSKAVRRGLEKGVELVSKLRY